MRSNLGFILATLLCGCGGSGQAPMTTTEPHLFSMTNAATGNTVVEFRQEPDGSLTPVANVATGGQGSGGGLGSQASIAADESRQQLLAVNTASDSISLLHRSPAGLVLVQTLASGGSAPISVAMSAKVAYVLNAGSSTVTALARNAEGSFIGRIGSARPLSGVNALPSQVALAPGGQYVFVTERLSDRIDVFPVAADGSLGEVRAIESAGGEPFAMTFDSHSRLYVAEAAHHQSGQSSTSSYSLSTLDGVLNVISPAVPDQQTAACWIDISEAHSTLYVTNTPSASISVYRVDAAGRLTLLTTQAAGGIPRDVAVAANHVYTVLASGELAAFAIQSDGSLAAGGRFGAEAKPAAGLVRLDVSL